jgi:hypothetical protein
MPVHVREAVAYLEKCRMQPKMSSLASEASAWLQRRQNEPQATSTEAAGKQKRKGR